MTPCTLSLPAVAWQVGPNGELCEDAQTHVLIEDGRWVTSKINEVDQHLVQEGKPGWWFWSLVRIQGIELQRAYPGDWIVRHDYGLEAMRNETFQAMTGGAQ